MAIKPFGIPANFLLFNCPYFADHNYTVNPFNHGRAIAGAASPSLLNFPALPRHLLRHPSPRQSASCRRCRRRLRRGRDSGSSPTWVQHPRRHPHSRRPLRAPPLPAPGIRRAAEHLRGRRREIRLLQAHQGGTALPGGPRGPPLRRHRRPQLHRKHERRQDLLLSLGAASSPGSPSLRLRDEDRRRRARAGGGAGRGSAAAAAAGPLLRPGGALRRRQSGPLDLRRLHVRHGVRAVVGRGGVDRDVEGGRGGQGGPGGQGGGEVAGQG